MINTDMIFSDPPDIPVITKYIECILYFNSRTKSALFNVAKKILIYLIKIKMFLLPRLKVKYHYNEQRIVYSLFVI